MYVLAYNKLFVIQCARYEHKSNENLYEILRVFFKSSRKNIYRTINIFKKIKFHRQMNLFSLYFSVICGVSEVDVQK